MNTRHETLVALYYNAPYENNRELVCICESGTVANQEVFRLMEEWPHLYTDINRFEEDLVRYVRRVN